MVTSKREFSAISKATAGYNMGADRVDVGDGPSAWAIYWSVGFLDPANAVAR
jgi:hypothetical protein